MVKGDDHMRKVREFGLGLNFVIQGDLLMAFEGTRGPFESKEGHWKQREGKEDTWTEEVWQKGVWIASAMDIKWSGEYWSSGSERGLGEEETGEKDNHGFIEEV